MPPACRKTGLRNWYWQSTRQCRTASNTGCAETTGEIEVRVEPQRDALRVIVRDDAVLFDPSRARATHLDLSPLDRAKSGGFGLELMHRLVDGVDYRITGDGQNELSLLKRRQ